MSGGTQSRFTTLGIMAVRSHGLQLVIQRKDVSFHAKLHKIRILIAPPPLTEFSAVLYERRVSEIIRKGQEEDIKKDKQLDTGG